MEIAFQTENLLLSHRQKTARAMPLSSLISILYFCLELLRDVS